MKAMATTLFTAAALLASTGALAGKCAQGYVTEVTEGGFSSNHLHVKMNYTEVVPPNSRGGYMRFLQTLPAERLKGIRALAYLAIANGMEVQVWTTNKTDQNVDDCTMATELKVCAPSSDPEVCK